MKRSASSSPNSASNTPMEVSAEQPPQHSPSDNKSSSTCNTTILTKRKNNKINNKLNFTDLNENIINEILTYGSGLRDWLVLMGTCRSLRHAVVHSHIWAEYPVDLCAIPTCFGCGRVRLLPDCVWDIICSQTVMQFARLHLSYPDLADCIYSLTKKCTIKKLHLRIYHNNHNPAAATSSAISNMLGEYQRSKSSDSGTQEDTKRDDTPQLQQNNRTDLLPPPPLALQSQQQASQQQSGAPTTLMLTSTNSKGNTSVSASSSSYSSLSSSANGSLRSANLQRHNNHAAAGDNSSNNTTSSSSSVSNDASSLSGGGGGHHRHHQNYSPSPSPSSNNDNSAVRLTAEEVARVLGTHWNNEERSPTESSSSTSSNSNKGHHHHVRRKHHNSNNIVEEYLYDPELPKLKLESLTIFGWPSSFASASSSSIANGVFQQIGGNLKILKLMESSPVDIFEIIARYCPLLETLMVEGFHSADIVITAATLQGKALKILGLHDTNLKIPEALQLPSLQRFEYVNQDDLLPVHVNDIEQLIQNLPVSVNELDIRVMSVHANECLRQIGTSLPNLQRLTLQLSHIGEAIPGDIYIGTLMKLAQCKSLTSLEIIGSCMVSIDEEAFLTLQQFRSLRKLKLLYEDDLIDLLPTLLANVEFLEEIIFFENAQDMQADIDGIQQWALMEDRLQSVSEMFPAIKISLVDCWWT